MKRRTLLYVVSILGVVLFGPSSAWPQFPNNPTFTTVFVSVPSGIEGLTGDNSGNVFVADRGTGGASCKVWRINTNTNGVDQVGQINSACRPSGLTFDANGDLFITTATGATQVIYQLTPDPTNPAAGGALGVAVVSGVPGNNGLAFDEHGNLFVSDGTTNQGRVWKISAFPADCSTNSNCEEIFRVQPMRNDNDLGGLVPDSSLPLGVGRENVTFPGAAQNIVANGLAFNRRGDLFVADTARGAIWKAEFDGAGNLRDNQTGCDNTFHPNTLCMDSLWVADPRLEGLDGIALDAFGNILGAVNERNAIVGVTSLLKRVIEIFRNPSDESGSPATNPEYLLRNDGPMEFPTSPFLSGRKLCITHADSNRRDNSPNTGGELGGTGEGKVSCMDQNLIIPGLPLPVQ